MPRLVRRAVPVYLAQLTEGELAVDNRLRGRGVCVATQRCFWVSVRRQAGLAATRWWQMTPRDREDRRNAAWIVCHDTVDRDLESRLSTRTRSELQAQYVVSRRCLRFNLSAMLASGLDLNAPDRLGRTLLWSMCRSAQANVVHVLLRLGASPTAYLPFGQFRGQLPMRQCVSCPNNTPQLLMNAGSGRAHWAYYPEASGPREETCEEYLCTAMKNFANYPASDYDNYFANYQMFLSSLSATCRPYTTAATYLRELHENMRNHRYFEEATGYNTYFDQC
jgi:hypothetical protein